MKEPFFEEYELRVCARVAIPKQVESGRMAKVLFETVEKVLNERSDMLVAMASATFIPLKGVKDE